MIYLVDQLLHLPTILGAVLLMGLTTLVGLVTYLLSTHLFTNLQSKDTRRAAGYLFRAIGILVSLFLSLTFADVVLELNQIKTSIEREAVMIDDIYRDLGRYESNRCPGI